MSSQYVVADDVVVERLDDGLCLFRATDDEVLVLNHTAADIWQLADSPSDISQLCRLLADKYDADPTELVDDVQRVLTELSGRGFLRTVDDHAAE